MAATDETLMAAYQRQGDVAAFEELVTRYERPLWSFLQRFVGNAATAEDLLQEVFLRVVNGAGEWKAEAKFSTWLYTIARNLCTDQARRAVHRRAISLDAPARRSGDDGIAGEAGVASASTADDRIAGQGEMAAMDRQLGAQIDRAVAGLPDDQREVFLMREVMDLPFADIARAVGVSEATAKSRMRYALEKLRQALADFRDVVAAPRTEEEAGQPARKPT